MSGIEGKLQDVSYVTLAGIQAKIADAVNFVVPGTSMVLAQLTLKSGYVMLGQAYFPDIGAFDEKVGAELAYNDAIRKLFDMEAYLLAEQQYRAGLENLAQ